MPDLVAVAGKLGAVPDLFIRDSVTDAGAVPSGFVSMSPDIIVRQASVPNAAVEFGEPGPWVNAMPPIDAVRAGQPNYLYARLRNRSLVDAAGATVTLFWSEPSPLVAPVHWNLIGALGGILVPAGGALTVAGPLVWTPAAGQLPASGHGCFVAMVEHPLDPAPPLLPGTATWDDFLAYIGRNNNAAWRNFTVLQPSATESGWAAEAAFVLRGAGDDAREFMIEVVQRVSPGIRIWWDVPPALATLIRRSSRSDGVELDQDEPRGERRLRLRPWRRIGLGPLPLAADTVYRCTLHVAIARAPRTGPDEIVVRQLWREREVGRLTWRIGEGG
jgi:hypothetical protein